MKTYQKNTKQENMTQVKTKDKTHQELIKEIWDDADKNTMEILDEPIYLNLDDPYDNFFPPVKNGKIKTK